MKRFLGDILVTAVIAAPALAALKHGDKAPEFTARASQAGKEFEFSLKKR